MENFTENRLRVPLQRRLTTRAGQHRDKVGPAEQKELQRASRCLQDKAKQTPTADPPQTPRPPDPQTPRPPDPQTPRPPDPQTPRIDYWHPVFFSTPPNPGDQNKIWGGGGVIKGTLTLGPWGLGFRAFVFRVLSPRGAGAEAPEAAKKHHQALGFRSLGVVFFFEVWGGLGFRV